MGFSSQVCVSGLDGNGILIWQWVLVEILSLSLFSARKPKQRDRSAPLCHPSLFCLQLSRLSPSSAGGILSCSSSARASHLCFLFFFTSPNDFSLSCAAVPASVSGQLKRKCLHPSRCHTSLPRDQWHLLCLSLCSIIHALLLEKAMK